MGNDGQRFTAAAAMAENDIPTSPFVFLGGSCNPTTWRKDCAVPMLQRLGVQYYNPQVENWYPELMSIENTAKHAATVVLIVIDSQTRAIMSLMEAIEHITTGRTVVLAIVNVEAEQSIGDDIVSSTECKDLNRARGYLRDVAARYGIKVHASVADATQDASEQVMMAMNAKRSNMEGCQ